MINISVQDTIKSARIKLVGFERQIPYAVARALTSTGKIVKDAEISEIKRVFDRPTRRTTSSVWLKYATKTRLMAKVWLVEDAFKGTPPVKYLYPEIHGGKRNRTRFEKALERQGYLARDESVMPSKYARLNVYGNISAGTYTKVLSQLKASSDPMQNATGSARSKKGRRAAKYFYKRDGKARGVWEQRGKTAKPVFVFVKKRPSYRERLDFYGVAKKTNAKHFSNEFDKSIIIAKKTARL